MKCVNKNKSWKPLKYAWISTFQSAKNEESLSTALQTLKDQVNHKRSSMNEQISHLESLREEVSWCQFSKVWKTEKIVKTTFFNTFKNDFLEGEEYHEHPLFYFKAHV